MRLLIAGLLVCMYVSQGHAEKKPQYITIVFYVDMPHFQIKSQKGSH